MKEFSFRNKRLECFVKLQIKYKMNLSTSLQLYSVSELKIVQKILKFIFFQEFIY